MGRSPTGQLTATSRTGAVGGKRAQGSIVGPDAGIAHRGPVCFDRLSRPALAHLTGLAENHDAHRPYLFPSECQTLFVFGEDSGAQVMLCNSV